MGASEVDRQWTVNKTKHFTSTRVEVVSEEFEGLHLLLLNSDNKCTELEVGKKTWSIYARRMGMAEKNRARVVLLPFKLLAVFYCRLSLGGVFLEVKLNIWMALKCTVTILCYLRNVKYYK